MNEETEALEVVPALNRWVRGSLIVVALGLLTVFGIAAWLNPYNEDGTPRRQETHRQMGLPPCTFYTFTGGYPCPSCGMTTSFSLLIHGDVLNSLKANAVGTALATFWLLLIPWCLISSWKAQPLFIVSIEWALSRAVVIFLILMLTRWAFVMITIWIRRHSG